MLLGAPAPHQEDQGEGAALRLKVQAWFLDDGTFVGREEDLVKVVDLLV